MSDVASASGAPNRSLDLGALRRVLRDQPVIPLIVLLAALVVVSDLVRPGIVNP